jgi:polygalacturonase
MEPFLNARDPRPHENDPCRFFAGNLPRRPPAIFGETTKRNMKNNLEDFASHRRGILWTAALQAAVDDCAAKGGGTVVIPPGEFLTGSIELRSNVTIEISGGAVLRGSPDLADYPVVPFAHNEFGEIRSLFWSVGQQNIRLRGAGEIDFNHPAFMEMDRPDLREKDAANLPLYTESQIAEMTIVAKPRPTQPVFFHDCGRVVVEDLMLRQSPCWTLSFSACHDVRVRGITVHNHLNVPNCDGIHISACCDVLVTGCVFHCADDCVAVTGITDWDRPSENVVISQCTMVSRSAAVRVGHLASKVRNVLCSDLVISDGNRGLLVSAGDEGWVKNVRATNIIMRTRLFAGFWWGKGEPLALMATGSGRIESVDVAHVRAETEGGIVIAGSAGGIRDISLDDWTLRLSAGNNRPLLGGWIDLQPADCPPLPPGRLPWLYADGPRQLRIRNVRAALNESDTAYSIEPIIRNCVVE